VSKYYFKLNLVAVFILALLFGQPITRPAAAKEVGTVQGTVRVGLPMNEANSPSNTSLPMENSASSQVAITTPLETISDQRGGDYEVGVGEGVPTYVSDAFVAAYNRNGGQGVIDEPNSDVHDWRGAWIQDFDWASIVYNPSSGTAYYIQGLYVSAWVDIDGPDSFLGLPTSDRYDPPAGALLMDKHSNFMNHPIQAFEGGFVGQDTEPSYGTGVKAYYYYPALLGATVQVEHYEIPDPSPPPDDPDATITKARVTLTAGNANLPHEDLSVAGIWVETHSSSLDGWIPNEGNTPKIWEDLEPDGEFSFRLELWVNNEMDSGQAGYLACDSYQREQNGEEFLETISIEYAGFYNWGYECDGFGGGGYVIDDIAPVITHSPTEDVWQNGKGWAIIAAYVTDNIAVDWVKVVVNGEEHLMTWLEGNTYVGIVPLKFGQNNYYILASDTSGNLARHPETGEHGIWSSTAFSYGYRPWMGYSEDPINSGIGNFIYTYTDANIPALGPDVLIQRWFNHQNSYDGPLGIGWTFLYDMKLEAVDNLLFSGVQVQYADGRLVNFDGDGAGGFTATETVHDTLEFVGSEYILTIKDQTAYHFNSDGQLTSIADKDGNTLTINYSGEQISAIVDGSGRTFTFTYTDGRITSIASVDYGTIQYSYQDGRLASATDANADTAVYTYNETGCLTSITSPEGKPFLADQSCDEDDRVDYQLGGTGFVNEFTYDDENRTTTILDPDGNATTHVYDEEYRLIESQDQLGNVTTYTYNEDYLPLTITDKNGNTTTYTYDENGNPLTVTDALGNATTYTYDIDSHLLSRTDALGNTYLYEYDAEGHLIRETSPLGGITEYSYNEVGLLVSTTNPLGSVTTTIYNDLGLAETVTDALGNTTTMTYDANGRLLSKTDPLGNTTTYQYNDLGQVIAMTDPEGYTTTYQYDGDQNLILETNADGYSRSYVYDDNNRLVAESDWQGNFTTYLYDDLARKISETDPLGNTLTYQYDAASRLISQTDKRGAITTFTYDANGNMLTQTDALGQVTTYTYDALNRQVAVSYPCSCPSRVEETIYDTVGRAIEQIDARGNSTYFEYDAMGREVRRINALGNETTRVYDLAGNLITEIDALGHTTHYTYDALNRAVAVTNRLGYTATQEYDAAGRLVAKVDERGNRTEFVYDGNGRLVQTIDALGNTNTITYDSRSNRLTLTDALGRTISFTYDGNGNALTMTNGRGYTTIYAYDALNQLVSTTDALDYSTTYTYDPAGAQLTATDQLGYSRSTTYDLLGRVLMETDRNGNTTSFAYDPAGNLSQVTDALGGVITWTYDPNNNKLSETNALGFTTFYVYDPLNRPVEREDALGGVWLSIYDALSRLTESVDANGHATLQSYDAEGQLITVTDALGHTSYRSYDPTGNLTSETDRNGNVTLHTYDALNREVILTNALGYSATTTYDAAGNVIGRVNFRGYATQLLYDENNNLVEQVDALGGITSFEYDPLDRLVSGTDANSHTTTYSHDGVGNRLTVTLPEGQISSYTYDGEKNTVSFTNGRGFTAVYTFDALNRQVTETDPMGHVTTTQYDAISQKTALIDANGNVTSYTYDAIGRLVVVTDALGHMTSYGYDAVGNRLSKTDANDHTTLYVYDAVNRLVSETNPIGSTWNYIYDPEGNLIQSTDAKGTTINYEFDAVHQMTAIRFANPRQDVTYTYDENGNMVRMVDPVGTTSLIYDALDREISKTDFYGHVTLNGYDAVGNRTSLTYPNGSQVNYIYNGNDWLITAVDPDGKQTSYSYEDDGQVRTIDNPNNTWTSHIYDDASRLVRLINETGHGNGSTITSYDYTLDAVGNRLEIVEEYTQGQLRTNLKTYAYNARYELLQAVEQYEGPPAYTVTTDYSYDSAGNRLSMTTNRDTGPGPQPLPQTTNYTYDAGNRMQSAGNMTFTYDANGNRLTKLTTVVPASQSRLERYQYDDQNRMVLYTRSRAHKNKIEQRVYNVYDGLGRRVNKGLRNASGRIMWTQYALDGLSYDQLVEFPQTGMPRITELYRGLDNQLLSMEEIQSNGPGTQYWFAHDGLESVAATTKQDGQSTHEFFYDPYGQLIDENGHWEDSSSWTNPHNHYLLSGKEWDEESRLYYFGARFYDAQVGVWITPDPYRGEAPVPISLHPYFQLGHNPPNQADNANDPMSLHRYLYVVNNPLNRIDPQGYTDCGPYAKCRPDGEIHPLIKLLFTSKISFSKGREESIDLMELIDEKLDFDAIEDMIPEEAEDFIEDYVSFELAYGYQVEQSVSQNPITLSRETCRSFSPYMRLDAALEMPIPGANLPILGVGEFGLRAGAGGSLALAGSISACIKGDINLMGGLDLTAVGKLEAAISVDASLRGYIKGVAEIDVWVASARAELEVGVRLGARANLIECSISGELSFRYGLGADGGCGFKPDVEFYADIYASLEAEAETIFDDKWDSGTREASYQLGAIKVSEIKQIVEDMMGKMD
jgi:RHS repeat-associated protein